MEMVEGIIDKEVLQLEYNEPEKKEIIDRAHNPREHITEKKQRTVSKY